MDLLDQIKKHLDPISYNLPQPVWNSLIINSRIRFHSFFRNFSNIATEETQALNEYRIKPGHFKQYLSTIVKYSILKLHFKNKKRKIISILSSDDIVLLKNFSYRASIDKNKFIDPFFLSFTDRLALEKNHLAIVDPLMSIKDTKLLLGIEGLNIIPWFTFLCFTDFLKVFGHQLKQFISFKVDNHNSWNKELRQELLHPTTFHHLLFYYAFIRICRTFSIKRFIVTFENNSWEKVVMLAFRENSPQTIIVGYQHSVVPESTLGMRFLPWEIRQKNLPDMIYTTGLETQNIIRSFNPGITIPINALCALRYEYLYSMPTKSGALRKNILVALEAIVEASELIKLMLELKDYLVANNFKVTFRFHPAMNYDFFKSFVDYVKLESFSTVSTALLSDDLNNNDCVFYWASTVALESSFIGNALINYQSHFPLSHDPLYKSTHLKSVIKNSNELKASIKALYALDLQIINSEREAARNYIKNYFYRPTPENLNTLLGTAK